MCPPTVVLSHQRQIRRLASCNPHVVVASAMRQASTTEAGQKQAMADAGSLHRIEMPKTRTTAAQGCQETSPSGRRVSSAFEAHRCFDKFPNTLDDLPHDGREDFNPGGRRTAQYSFKSLRIRYSISTSCPLSILTVGLQSNPCSCIEG